MYPFSCRSGSSIHPESLLYNKVFRSTSNVSCRTHCTSGKPVPLLCPILSPSQTAPTHSHYLHQGTVASAALPSNRTCCISPFHPTAQSAGYCSLCSGKCSSSAEPYWFCPTASSWLGQASSHLQMKFCHPAVLAAHDLGPAPGSKPSAEGTQLRSCGMGGNRDRWHSAGQLNNRDCGRKASEESWSKDSFAQGRRMWPWDTAKIVNVGQSSTAQISNDHGGVAMLKPWGPVLIIVHSAPS